MHSALDVLHLDMDCFFAAVEVQAAPELSGRPVIVGGLGPRGVVAAASYEARVFGVRSAMPMAEARRRCPSGVYLSGRHELYAEKSRALLDLLRTCSPVVEPVALDEAYVDLSGAHRLLGSSASIANRLRDEVTAQLGLACSVGVGRTKLVAKLASRAAKPQLRGGSVVPGRGVVVVEPEEESGFLHEHRVRDLPGAGPKTTERLARLGVHTLADLALFGREGLVAVLGRSQGNALFDLSSGRDDRRVVADREVKSIGSEETFDVDQTDALALESKVRELADHVGARCRSGEVVARTVTVKVRFGDFSLVTRARTLATPTSSSSTIAEVARELLREVPTWQGVRLLGVAASGFGAAGEEHPMQLDLFATREDGDSPQRSHEGAERAADEIRRRFGPGSIRSVAAATRPAPRNGPTNGPILGR